MLDRGVGTPELHFIRTSTGNEVQYSMSSSFEANKGAGGLYMPTGALILVKEPAPKAFARGLSRSKLMCIAVARSRAETNGTEAETAC